MGNKCVRNNWIAQKILIKIRELRIRKLGYVLEFL